jgi:NADPH:quinone reductase-like Zn-dependent oxidoreductase
LDRAVLPHGGNRIGAIVFGLEKAGVRVLITGMSTMIGKMMVGLAAAAIVASVTPMSASAQESKLKVAIPKRVCEMVTADTQNWGKQKVQICGPAGARGQATTTTKHQKHQSKIQQSPQQPSQSRQQPNQNR